MTQRTTADETLSRDEFAAYLRDLAAEFERSDGEVMEGDEEAIEGNDEVIVPVGNKNVALRPPETLSVSVEVVERSSMLRGDRETVDIELSWKP